MEDIWLYYKQLEEQETCEVRDNNVRRDLSLVNLDETADFRHGICSDISVRRVSHLCSKCVLMHSTNYLVGGSPHQAHHYKVI